MGLATAAGSLGQFVFAPLGQAFIAGYGAVTALMLLSGFVVLVPVLALALTGRGEESAEPEVSTRDAIRGALSHPSYLLLTAGFFVCGFHIAFVTTHLPPYLGDLGFSASLAAWSVALIGLFNIIGSIAAGVLGSRLPKRYLLSTIYALRAIVITAFLLVPLTPASALTFGACMGVLWLSTVPLTSGLVALMFGVRYMATLFGFVFFSHQVGAAVGVWLGGLLYEQTGSYDVVWWLGAVLGIVAGLVNLPIREQPVQRIAAAPA